MDKVGIYDIIIRNRYISTKKGLLMKTNYLMQVLRHKWFVLIAGLRVGNFPLWRLIIHDWTKFLPIEYNVYKRRFTGRSYTEDEWKKAWWHHIHFNPHHYQYWLIKSEPIPIPDVFIREMVIDWMGAGKEYEGTWNIQPWLNANYHKMIIHPSSLEKLKVVLESQGFRWPGE